jgi:hypothetical protein
VKYSILLCFLLFSSTSFSQQRNEKIIYFCIDRTGNGSSPFVTEIKSIINSLNQTDRKLIGKFRLPDDEFAAENYYDEPGLNALKNANRSKGAYLVCFEIDKFNNSAFVDERILTIKVVNLRATSSAKQVILKKNVIVNDLKSVLTASIKYHLLKMFSGLENSKPSLFVYEDGSHSFCKSYVSCYRSLFVDTLLLKKFYIERVENKQGNGKSILSTAAGNDFIFINNIDPVKKLQIDCDRPILKRKFDEFINLILTSQ